MAKINTDEYDYVIFDRYVQSNMIHQSTRIADRNKLDDLLNWIDDFEFVKMHLPRPDKVLFLDVPVEISLKLANARADLKNGQSRDIFEEDKQHMFMAYENAKHSWDRNLAVKVMAKLDMLTPEMINECRYDECRSIRDLVSNLLKKEIK